MRHARDYPGLQLQSAHQASEERFGSTTLDSFLATGLNVEESARQSFDRWLLAGNSIPHSSQPEAINLAQCAHLAILEHACPRR